LLKVRSEWRAAETKYRTEQRHRVSIRHRVFAQRTAGELYVQFFILHRVLRISLQTEIKIVLIKQYLIRH